MHVPFATTRRIQRRKNGVGPWHQQVTRQHLCPHPSSLEGKEPWNSLRPWHLLYMKSPHSVHVILYQVHFHDFISHHYQLHLSVTCMPMFFVKIVTRKKKVVNSDLMLNKSSGSSILHDLYQIALVQRIRSAKCLQLCSCSL